MATERSGAEGVEPPAERIEEALAEADPAKLSYR
jgi:hypothetical protein